MNAQLQQMLANLQGGGAQRAVDAPLPDTAETVYISSLSLLKMLKHGELHPQGIVRRGLPDVQAVLASRWR